MSHWARLLVDLTGVTGNGCHSGHRGDGHLQGAGTTTLRPEVWTLQETRDKPGIW